MVNRFLSHLALLLLPLYILVPLTASAEISLSPELPVADPLFPPAARPLPGILLPNERLSVVGLSVTSPDTREKSPENPLLFAEEKDQVPKRDSGKVPESEWRWRRAKTADYAAITAVAVGTLYLENEHGDPSARWTARNDFDEGIRDAFRLQSRSARDAANDAGTALMGLMLAAPIVDSFATLGLRDSRWDAVWQTEIINAEALTFAGAVSSLLQNLIIPRERPFVRNCKGGQCEDSPLNRSMPSGHTVFAFTGAGLVCTHHHYQSLYNDPGADRAACVTGLGVATVDGILRIVADRHYATDVIAGAAIGMFSGFLLPRWLYYYRPQQTAGESEPSGKSLVGQMTVTPVIYSDGAGLNYTLTF